MAACRGAVLIGKLGSEGGSRWDSGRTSPWIQSPGCVELKLEDMIGVVR